MPATPDPPRPAGSVTVQDWLASTFGEAADPRDAAAELRMTLRNAADRGHPELVSRLAELARSAIAAGQNSSVEILLALLDTAAAELGTDDARYLAAVERGRYELAAGRPERCLAQLAMAEPLAGTPELQSNVHYNSGLAWLQLGNTVEAESHLRAALALATSLNDVENIVQSTNLLADLAARRNEPGEMQSLLDQALSAAEGAGRADLVAYLTMMHGVLHARTGEFAAAGEEYRRLAELSATSGPSSDPGFHARAQAAALSGQIALSLRQGEAAAAAELAPRLRALLDHQRPGEQVNDLITLSQIRLAGGELPGALLDCRQALSVADEHGLQFERAHALLELALIYALSGAFEPAHRSCVTGLEVNEYLRAAVGDVASRLAFGAERFVHYELAVQLCLVLAELRQDPGYRAEALSWVERGKSRTLSELLGLASLPAPPSVPDALLAAEHRLLEEIRAQESGGTRSRAAYGDIWRQLESVWATIAATAPEYVALRRGRTVQPDQIRRMLRHPAPPETGLTPPAGRPDPSPDAQFGGELPGTHYSRPREVELPLPGGGSAKIQIAAEHDAVSRRWLLDRLTAADPVADRLSYAVRYLAIIDSAWWSRFDAAATAGLVPDAMQLGRLLCDCVAAWGEPGQLLAASAWRNSHLVPRLCHDLADLPADDAGWEAVRSVLAQDRAAGEVCRELREHHLLPPLAELDDLLAAEADWLDSQFFQHLADQVRAAAVDGRIEVAAARFLAAIRAATVLAGTHQERLAVAEAFVDQFPEYRFTPAPLPG